MLVKDRKHRPFLAFLAKILDAPVAYSKQDLLAFRNLASHEHPSAVPIIDAYIHLAERSDSDVTGLGGKKSTKTRPEHQKPEPVQMHLFDLLRDKRLFASNSELGAFADRVLPGIKSNRFDKMSRGDIAARIIEHLESKDNKTREDLEASMRSALTSPPVKPADRKSFFSKWEAIIKGIQL